MIGGSTKKFKGAICAVFAAACMIAGGAKAENNFITIGTGGVTGVYYPTGGAICRLVNRGHKDHGIRCSVEATGGSVYNVNSLRQGGMDVAIVQSDWQYHAAKGTDIFASQGPFEDIRSIFSLHTEAFTVVVRDNSDIKSLSDLPGKRVNIGNPGSGNRATMDVLMRAKGWTKDTFKIASELKAQEQAQALCDGKIDVMIYSAGHPNGAVQEVATSCDVRILSLEGDEVDSIVNDNPFYSYTTIPGGMYNGNPDDVKTFGVKATFVTTSKVEEDTIYQIVKSVFDNFENFKTLHPVFTYLEEQNLIKEGNTAELHDGAKKYYRERGWID